MTQSTTASAPRPNQAPTPLAEKPASQGWTFKHGFLLAFVLFMVLNSMPFADAARFRKAVEACEKNLPRDQHCDVQGVVVQSAKEDSKSAPSR